MSEREPAGVHAEEPSPISGSYVAPPAAPEPPRRKSGGGTFFLGALSGCLLVIVAALALGLVVAALRSSGSGIDLTTQKVAVVPIEGEILDARDTIDAIHRYADNAMVKAIIIRIDSPGGAIAPAQEIYSEIRKVRAKSGKPFVASFDTVAASGGFYIAAACDRIVSNPGTITGSIGVILQWLEVKDLLEWAKMKPETITSGAMKAAGSPFRELTDAERQYFQRVVLQLHSQFVRAVAAGRKGKLTEAEVSRLADGRVFTGEEAVALKLVDQLGNLDDAVRLAGSLAGIKGTPGTIYPKKRKNELLELLTDSSDAQSFLNTIVNRRLPRFLYRW